MYIMFLSESLYDLWHIYFIPVVTYECLSQTGVVSVKCVRSPSLHCEERVRSEECGAKNADNGELCKVWLCGVSRT